MKRRIISLFAGALLATGILGSAASAQTQQFVVDCSKKQNIGNAILRGDERKPLLVLVRGTCNEFVTISRDKVTLRGDPAATIVAPNSNTDLVAVNGNDVTLENLTLTGGYYGVRNNQVFRLMIVKSVIQDTASDGVRAFVGDTRINNSTIQRAGGNGIYGTRGATVAPADSQIVDNAGAGIYVLTNSTVASSRSTISENGSNGVQLENGSVGNFNNNVIEGNGTNPEKGGAGIAVAQSRASVGWNNTIRSNRADGVLVVAGATANVEKNSITGNGGHGVNGYLGALLVLNGNVISDNAYSGVVGYAHSTVQIAGATIENNRGGAGISMMLGSKLILEGATTRSLGNVGALWCGDPESSVNDLSLLDFGGDTVSCSGY